MTTQAEVYAAIKERGYTEAHVAGETIVWAKPIMLGRQLTKLIEELGELGQHLDGSHAGTNYDVTDGLLNLSETARDDFDNMLEWCAAQVEADENQLDDLDITAIKAELADIQVVLFVMAEVLQQYGEPFDLVEAARSKAWADVKRGVR